MTDSEKESLRTLVNYLWKAENSRSAIRSEDLEVFRSLVKVRQYLDYAEESVSVRWHPEDVKEVRPDLNDMECKEVLEALVSNHDANIGVNWDQIEYWASELYPQEQQNPKKLMFQNILDIVPEIESWCDSGENLRRDTIRLAAEGSLPLKVGFEHSGGSWALINVSHHERQSTGELVPCPEMKVLMDFEKQSAIAVEYRDEMAHHKVERADGSANVKLGLQLNLFLEKWLSNIKDQSYVNCQSAELCYG